MHQMTTRALQHGFPEVYNSFYREHDLVLSLPFQFRRVQDIPRGPQSLLIKQQLPTKLYLGLTPQRRPGVFFGTYTSWSYGSGFVREPIQSAFSMKQLQPVTAHLEAILHEAGYVHGVQIDILSEQQKGYGLGFFGVFSVALASMVFLLTGRWQEEIISKEVGNNQHLVSKDLVDLAVYLDQLMHGAPSGMSVYQAFYGTGEPIIQFGSCISADEGVQNTALSKIVPLSELVGVVCDETTLPIDYGIISFGIEHDEEGHRRYVNQLYDEAYVYYNQLTKKLQLPREMRMPHHLPSRLLTKYLKISLLKDREQMIYTPHDVHAVESFVQSIASMGMHAVAIEKQRQQIFDLYTLFNNTKKFTTENIGFTPLSTVKVGGSLLFACHKAQSRQTVYRMLDAIRQYGYEGAHFIYLSWRDGWCTDTLRVEQWISRRHYSEYVHTGSVVLVASDGDHTVMEGYEDIYERNEGILFDQLRGKVHIAGKKLTYKDIPSQPGTVEIVGLLLENKGKFCHNKLFPTSSYSKNKNEMMGKIILPLIRLVRTHFGQDVVIECKGNVFEFSLKLQDDKGLFYLIKQVGN